MQREETAGASLREGIMEVAFEQRTERAEALVDFDVIPTLQGSNIGTVLYWQSAEIYISEVRW